MLYAGGVESVNATAGLQTSDGELVRRIAAATPGEAHDAETELYRRLAPRVRMYGLRHLRNEEAADDLAQQVLWITMESLRCGRLREPDKLASFVLGTCRMVVLDIRRGAARRGRLLDQYARDLPVATAPAPAQYLDRDRLADCLEGLGERERSVIVMSFYDEQATKQVADFLGVPASSVRVIRHRALVHLRECMS